MYIHYAKSFCSISVNQPFLLAQSFSSMGASDKARLGCKIALFSTNWVLEDGLRTQR